MFLFGVEGRVLEQFVEYLSLPIPQRRRSHKKAGQAGIRHDKPSGTFRVNNAV